MLCGCYGFVDLFFFLLWFVCCCFGCVVGVVWCVVVIYVCVVVGWCGIGCV